MPDVTTNDPAADPQQKPSTATDDHGGDGKVEDLTRQGRDIDPDAGTE